MQCARYVPDDPSPEALGGTDAWRADARTAAAACLLLLCAARESLNGRHVGDALALVGALGDVCASLERGDGRGGLDALAWGCDLDPGSSSACAAAGSSQHGALAAL